MLALLAVALGGALGSSLRYGIFMLTSRASGPEAFYGTFAVNFIGALAIGLLAGGEGLPVWLRAGLILGVLGGFTTFSAFCWEALLRPAGDG